MASLSFIVDPMDDDGNDKDRSATNKKDQGGRRYTSTAHSSTQPSSSLSFQSSARSLSPSAAAKRRTSKRSSATVTSSSSSSTSINTTAPPRRLSSDDMDHRAYVHGGSSSNTPMRPMGVTTSPSSIPVKLTPITGRVSRAKKGVPVHICETCKPPKTFTRAEHLRRHQLSHETPKYACQYPGCDKAFHRQDLLQRHQQRHEQEGSGASATGGSRSRALSSASSTGTMTSPPMFNSTYQTPPTTSKSPVPGGPLSPPTATYGLQHPSTHYQPPPTQYGGAQNQPGQQDSVQTPRSASMPGFNPNTYAAPTPVATSPAPSPFENRDTGAQPSGAWSSSQNGLYPPAPDYGTVQYAGYYNTDNTPPMGPVSYPYQPSAGVIGQQTAGYPDYGSITASAGMASPLVVSPAPCPSPVGGAIHASSSPHAYAAASPLPAGGLGLGLGSKDGAAMFSWSSTNSTVSSIGPSTMSATNIPMVVNSTPMEIDMDMEVDAGLLALTLPTIQNPYISGPCVQPVTRSSQLQGAQAAVPEYLDVYWKKVAPRLPIVHPHALSADAELDDIAHAVGNMDVGGAPKTEVLKCAMAAVATQFMSDKEAKARGSQLHEWALGEVKTSCELSNVQVMQTIVLCEYFSRFRGRKVVVRPSDKFEWVYRQLLNDMSLHSALQQPPTFATWLRLETRRRLLSACFLLDMHASILQAQTSLTSKFLPPQPVHLPFPLSSYTAALWECADEGTWTSLLNRSTRYLAAATSEPRVVPPPGTMSPDMAAQLSRQPFDECLLTAAEALNLATFPAMSHSLNNINLPTLMLPSPTFISTGGVRGGMDGSMNVSTSQRNPSTTVLSSAASSVSLSSSLSSQGSLVDDSSDSEYNDDDDMSDGNSNSIFEAETREFESLATQVRSQGSQLVFPDSPTALAYAALRATPLLALLAVSGDSWLFAHKVVHRGSFVGYKRRVRAWASSSACGVAARLAARALLGLISPSSGDVDRNEEPWMSEISGYWTVYVCCLILWAYGYRGPLSADASNEKNGATIGVSEGEVFTWLKQVGELAGTEEANIQTEMMLKSKRLSEGLVSNIKKRFDGAGAYRCRLFVDAGRVLSTLGQDRGQRTGWF